MPKTMLINVTHPEESRVGIVTESVLSSFEIESFSREHLKGNIYKGVVHRIHPALEAAFVDIGADRDAFLPLDEICYRNLPTPVRNSGNGGEARRRPRINEILKPGDEILVQIVKEQFGNKPPTLSTFYSLPGRYLVLLPGSDEAGISRRIEGSERVRIRELIEKLHPPESFGIIVRTVAGFDQGSRELQRDLSYLLRLWETIQQAAATKRGPALVYREHDLVLRNIRDYFTPDIDEIYIDHEEVYQRAREFLRDVMPGKEEVLRLYTGDKPLFSHFNVESQIESIYKRRVPLKSGGGIVIDGTEALTAIDVNSGRSVRGASQEETAFRTNMEAALEIARQLRLRDLGGLIVIDFIDMRNPQHIGEVERTVRAAMHEDKARHEAGRISHFGLMEISRQRLRPAAAATSYVACSMCEGHGLVRTTESAALVALRKIHNRVAQGDAAMLRVSLPTDVAVYLLNQKREDLAQLEHRYATRIQVVLSPSLMPHQSEFEVRQRAEGEPQEQPQVRLGGVASAPAAPAAIAEVAEDISGNGAAVPVAAEAGTPTAAAPDAAKPVKRRRRRGRRRGRGRQAASALGDALSALAASSPLLATTASGPDTAMRSPATVADGASAAARASTLAAPSGYGHHTAGPSAAAEPEPGEAAAPPPAHSVPATSDAQVFQVAAETPPAPSASKPRPRRRGGRTTRSRQPRQTAAKRGGKSAAKPVASDTAAKTKTAAAETGVKALGKAAGSRRSTGRRTTPAARRKRRNTSREPKGSEV